MIIVSNEKVPGKIGDYMTFDEFCKLAYGPGIERDDLAFNVNDISEQFYNDLKDAGMLKNYVFFTTKKGVVPKFVDVNAIENWMTNDILIDEELGLVQQEVEDKTNGVPKNDAINIVTNLLEESDAPQENAKDARIVTFGSSKGGTGKTFTAIISTYRYAKTHPYQKIALIDFDIMDGQVAITIHKKKPTMREYYTSYSQGYRDFKTMQAYAARGNTEFPQNVDFYLAPPNTGHPIKDDAFWINILDNCRKNYDVVVIDTGIGYLEYKPISYSYKLADKINLITTTSIKSVNSVSQQIEKLCGNIENPVYSEKDGIASHLNIIITQMSNDSTNNDMNKTIVTILRQKANIIAKFGVINKDIAQAEFYGNWRVFDNNAKFNEALDKIMS